MLTRLDNQRITDLYKLNLSWSYNHLFLWNTCHEPLSRVCSDTIWGSCMTENLVHLSYCHMLYIEIVYPTICQNRKDESSRRPYSINISVRKGKVSTGQTGLLLSPSWSSLLSRRSWTGRNSRASPWPLPSAKTTSSFSNKCSKAYPSQTTNSAKNILMKPHLQKVNRLQSIAKRLLSYQMLNGRISKMWIIIMMSCARRYRTSL